MTEWYDMTEGERIKNIYSKYTIQNFWDWWSDGKSRYMEVRIKDYKLIKEVAGRLYLPWSASGIYVKNCDELKKVIVYTREKATVWFGIQPRKKNYNKKVSFKTFGGTDYHVDEVAFLFIDIDRINKESRSANNEELKNCDILSNKILECLAVQEWNKSYMKICSGNGVQLLIKLDYPFKVPSVEFDTRSGKFICGKEFELIKEIIRKGIGQDIIKFGYKLKSDLNVFIDGSSFSLSKVGALPVTKNYKYGGFTWRGIVEMKDGVNAGLSDYIMSKEDNIVLHNEKNVFSNKSTSYQDGLRVGKLREHKLVKFMLDNKFPEGYINNTLWMQIKCLLRDCKIDLHSKEFILLHNELKKKHNRTFTLNIPDKKYTFNKNIINRFCIENLIPPLYELWSGDKVKKDLRLDNLNWDRIDYINGEDYLQLENDIFTDMDLFKKTLVEGDYGNVDKIIKFTKGCINKYGLVKTKYYFDYVFREYFFK